MPHKTTTMDRISEVEKLLGSLSKEVLQDEKARKKLVAVLKEQINALETPHEVIWRLMFSPNQSAALRIAMGMGVIESLIRSPSSQSAKELAAITKCNKELIVRTLRLLAAMKVIDEVGNEQYAANLRTRALAIPYLGNGFKFMFDACIVPVIHMPKFFAKNGYQIEGSKASFQPALNTDLKFFEWLMAHPTTMSGFNDMMTGHRLIRTPWFDFSGVKSMIFDGLKNDENETLLVDIGGGRGHELEAFQDEFPDAKGKLVLQELPNVLADIAVLQSSIIRMEHDFFTEQPIKGARAYYLRSILHDWTDDDCKRILKPIVAAMEPGYSKVLINEWCLPDVGTHLFPCTLDITMLAICNGVERNEGQWRRLLDSVGLEIANIWTLNGQTEALIEAVKKV